jgi:transposase
MTMQVFQIALLENAYREGLTIFATTKYVEVSGPTVRRYFARFADEGIKRGTVLRRVHHPRWYTGVGPYTGPDWIGKPA